MRIKLYRKHDNLIILFFFNCYFQHQKFDFYSSHISERRHLPFIKMPRHVAFLGIYMRRKPGMSQEAGQHNVRLSCSPGNGRS